jgi:hypothetical protein
MDEQTYNLLIKRLSDTRDKWHEMNCVDAAIAADVIIEEILKKEFLPNILKDGVKKCLLD